MMSKMSKVYSEYKESKIAIFGLGYVGLPLALEFGKYREVVGFDISKKRIEELIQGYDRTQENTFEEINAITNLTFTNNLYDIRDCKIFIVTVPTPIDKDNNPDLTILKTSCENVGSLLKIDDIVIFESTVYPCVTEDICVPILEKKSGLFFNRDFYCGYSSERINPGDKERRLTMIKKVTSGSNTEIAEIVDKLYKQIIKAGTHKAPSIKIAEAAKVIENIQRDVNIALINEFAIIFNKLGIDTKSVLDAANTKWNFLPFTPGLVGGHCISVDPYYLLHKSLEVGYEPKIITAGRETNNNMGTYVVEQVIDLMYKKSIERISANVLIMGFTFKANCPDIRNTQVIKLFDGFKNKKLNVDIYEPIAFKDEIYNEYGIKVIDKPAYGKYDVIVIAVDHDQFKEISPMEIKSFGKDKSIIYDIKYILDVDQIDGRI